MEAIDWKFWLQTFLVAVATLYAVLTYHRGERVASRGASGMRRHYVVIGILLALTWAAVGFDYYDRHYGGAWYRKPLTQVRDRTFKGRTIQLDGYDYINCTFEDVTFEYEGTAPTRFTGKYIVRPGSWKDVTLRSNNPVVKQTMLITMQLNKIVGVPEGTVALEVESNIPEDK